MSGSFGSKSDKKSPVAEPDFYRIKRWRLATCCSYMVRSEAWLSSLHLRCLFF
ncbi:hypothetical protein VCHA52P453_30133 [Vibrio chagasii]|nr:hypothetical protein VCHA52P453_30133 [Vibrio chagasii]CAH7314527.1 hypothetical protein VCHA39P226_40180 [Vibrio chagasii]CAH7345859.1 hypothetical protein VCHA52P456_50133 [Vibrio chagasii]